MDKGIGRNARAHDYLWDFSPDGITKHLGGESQVLATDYYFNYDKSDIEAAAFHIKTAKKLGIDGFQFFYPYPPNDVFLELYNDLIASFFKAADKYGIDFKFCLCLCSPPPRVAEDKKIDVFAKHIKSLIKKVGIDHPNWMRTPDGRFITYVWNGDYMGLPRRLAKKSRQFCLAPCVRIRKAKL